MRRLGRPPYESMTDESGPPPPVEPSELAPDRCPNCGGKLKFSENRPEGLCSACGIFVEVLRPSEPKPPVRPLPAKVKIRTGTTKELQLLCRKYGLPSDGTKADLVARLLFFVDEQGWQAKVREKESQAPASTPTPPTEDVASRKQWATFFMDYESELGEEDPEAKDEKPAPGEETPAEPRAEPPIATPTEAAAPSEEQIPERPRPEEAEPTPAVEPSDSPPPPEPESAPEELPPPPEAESRPESIPEDEGELPTPPDEIVPAEPMAEPEFEPLAPEPVAPAYFPAERTVPVATAHAVPPRSRAPSIHRSRWRRVVYYVGVFYVTIGGAGLVLGSFLHDLFRVPLFGESYVAFGRLNVGAVLIGMILLGVGFAAMAVGMRRTPMRTRGAAGA